VVQKAGGIDALICNAGYLLFGSIEEMSEELLIKQFNVNVFGHLRTIQAVLPYMREKRSGNIILISSIAGSLVIPYEVHYSATKYTLEAFAEGLRQELHGFDIKVSTIRPGYIDTKFALDAMKYVPGNSPYRKWSDIMWVEITKLAQKALPPIAVAKQVYRILKKCNPKSFYTVASFVESLGPFLAPVLPSAVKEKFIRMFYRING
jgi:short-subunit dehydrogenase